MDSNWIASVKIGTFSLNVWVTAATPTAANELALEQAAAFTAEARCSSGPAAVVGLPVNMGAN